MPNTTVFKHLLGLKMKSLIRLQAYFMNECSNPTSGQLSRNMSFYPVLLATLLQILYSIYRIQMLSKRNSRQKQKIRSEEVCTEEKNLSV